MDINEIKLLFGNQLAYFDKVANPSINEIGVPAIVLNKYIPYYEENSDITFFSKSNISNLFLGIDKKNGNIVCFSKEFHTCSFVNSNYEAFIKVNFINEMFRKYCIPNAVYGAYYDNTPEGGNFEKYANALEKLIKEIDERATKEGVWLSLIEEMKLGVI